MRYCFDVAKNAANRAKHGFDLSDAPRVIESGAVLTFRDRRFDYGEDRFITIGPLEDKLVVVVTAETDDVVRVISMREATSHEKEIFRSQGRRSATADR
jgi:uncharacterized DUF497 family protein